MVLLLFSAVFAQTTEQEQGIQAQAFLSQASELFRQGKLRRSAEQVAQAEALLLPLSESDAKATRIAAKKLLVKIRKAKKLLKDQGITIPPVADHDIANGASSNASAGPTSKVSFAKHIAPVLVENCLGCHGAERQRANLSFANFDDIAKGGRSGSFRVPGLPPTENLLIRKLRGSADGEQMPLGDDPLPETTIQQLEDWLAAGAGFDGDDPQEPLEDVVAAFESSTLSADELFSQRKKLDQEKWSLAFPNVEAQKVANADLRVIGSADSAPLQPMLSKISSRMVEVLAELGLPSDATVKGGLTVFILERRFEYAEFCQMVERRDLPEGVLGHWHHSATDPYIVVVRPGGNVEESELLVRVTAELGSFFSNQMAGASRKMPDWFQLGMGRAITARLSPKSPSVRGWTDETKAILRGGMTASDFFQGNLSPKQNALVSYLLVSRMFGSKNRMRQFSTALRNGADFESAFQSAYRSRPIEMLSSLARGVEHK